MKNSDSRKPALAGYCCAVALLYLLPVVQIANGAGAATPEAKMFTATGILNVEPGLAGEGTGGPTFSDLLSVYFSEIYVTPHILGFRNYRVLDAALKKLDGKQNLYTGSEAVRRLADALSIQHVPRSFTMIVSLRGPDAAQVTSILNEVLKQYLEQYKEEQAQIQANRELDLRIERDNLRSQLGDLDRKVKALIDEANVVVVDGQPVEQLERLKKLNRLLVEAQVRLAEDRREWENFNLLREQAEKDKDLTPLLMASPGITDRVYIDPVILALRQDVARREFELEQAKAKRTPDESGKADVPSKQTDSAQPPDPGLQAARTVLDNHLKDTLGRAFQEHAADLRARYNKARGTETELLTRIKEAQAEFRQAGRLAADMLIRQREYQRVEERLKGADERLQEIKKLGKLMSPTLRVSRWPEVPTEPDRPGPPTGSSETREPQSRT